MAFQIGDKVKAVEGYFKKTSKFYGTVGTITEIEESDGITDYRVVFPGGGWLDDTLIEGSELELAN